MQVNFSHLFVLQNETKTHFLKCKFEDKKLDSVVRVNFQKLLEIKKCVAIGAF